MRTATPRVGESRYVPFRDRHFIAWDGEGDTERDTYILFGCSKGFDVASPSLTATECFQLIIDMSVRFPSHIHVAFAFDYDVSMMCASLPLKRREQLVTTGVTWFNHYRLEYRKNKWFVLTDRERQVTVRIFDVFSFFACSALKAWREYLPDEEIYQEVIAGKHQRSLFAYRNLSTIRRYMHLELKLYVKLVDKLRLLLAELGVHPRGWYGPGAVASAVMTKFGITKAMDRELPEDVIVAAQYAYFGGRFEQFHAGLYDGPVYTYDRRSAYPDALRFLPTLAGGQWIHRTFAESSRPTMCPDFSLYKLRYYKGEANDSLFTPAPFPLRDVRHCVHYPNHTIGWYWGIEVNAALDNLQSGDRIKFEEAWEFTPANDSRPFAFIEGLFEQRQRWKDDRNPVQLAAKLILNSIYGKLAQRVGWNREKYISPTWHQLEWAGFTTAHCRAQIYRALCHQPHAVIAVETDGLFSTVPLSLGEDHKRLGDWEADVYDGLLYVQSGVYWKREPLGYDLDLGYGWTKVKVRGLGPGDLTFDEAYAKLDTFEPLIASTHRFAALKGFWNKPEFTTWLDAHRTVVWGGGGKRHHNPELCPLCLGADLSIHPLAISYPTGGESVRHVLPWRDLKKNPWWDVIPDAQIAIRLSPQP